MLAIHHNNPYTPKRSYTYHRAPTRFGMNEGPEYEAYKRVDPQNDRLVTLGETIQAKIAGYADPQTVEKVYYRRMIGNNTSVLELDRMDSRKALLLKYLKEDLYSKDKANKDNLSIKQVNLHWYNGLLYAYYEVHLSDEYSYARTKKFAEYLHGRQL